MLIEPATRPRHIIAISEHSVSFRWTHLESGEKRITTVKGSEFLRLFLQHILPRGYRRVRHFKMVLPEGNVALPEGKVVLPIGLEVYAYDFKK